MLIKSKTNNIIYCSITLKSIDRIILTNYINKIKKIFLNYNFKFSLISIPKKIKRYYILRSPHVYKKSIETFEEIKYSSTFNLIIQNYQTYLHLIYIIKFLKYNIPLSINITFKLQNNVQTNIL